MERNILIIKHIDIEGPGTLEYFLRSQNFFKLEIVELYREKTLPPIETCAAVISLGGPMNVYETDKYPFLKTEEDFLKSAIEKEIPILGICLGAQLLAKVCGSSVKKAKHKEIGWYKISLTDYGKNDKLFSGLADEIIVFQWHEDTFEIPKNALHLAKSKNCSNQAFRYGKNSYGIQFHIEVTSEMIENWFLEYKEKNLDIKKILSQTQKLKDELQKEANLIYSNFLNIIKNRVSKNGI
jgi:GMP synthase-like glutamine amidotransferase